MINKENILFLINRLGKFFNFKRGKNKEELINLINEVENDIIEKNNKIEYLMNDNNIWKVNYKSLETEKNNTIGILEKKNMFVSSILNSNK
ncbi:hypothetical protein, partial [Brachyspira pulli]|uniref:hypothetical protein n=1 Tax=Brachyspira pulli TaxID=310721 RepID=UPI003005BAA8